MDDNYRISIEIDPFEQDRIRITTPFPGRDKELITQLPGAKFRKDEGDQYFQAPLSWASCVTMTGLYGNRLQLGNGLNTWAWNEWINRVQPSMALRSATEAEGDQDLYPFQRAAVRFLTFARQALLCDDMGLGKTVEAIRALMNLTAQGEQVFPALIIAPSSMVLTWAHEIDQWWPVGLTIIAVPGGLTIKERRDRLLTPAHIHIVSYETARAHSRLTGYGNMRLKRCIVCDKSLPKVNEKGQAVNQQSKCHNCPKELNRQWKTIIVDEIHRLKDPQAMQTRAIWALREGTGVKGVGPADFAIGLTGTPVADHPGDLWPALRFARPNEFQSKEEFTGRYCEWGYNFDREGEGHPKIIGLHPDPQRRQEFFAIIDPIMRRMPKNAVLPQLPERIYNMRYVQMAAKQRTAYDRMERDMVAEVDNGVVVAINPLVKLTRLGQFASAYATLVDNEVQLIEPSCKIDALMEILSDMGDKPVVVFAVHKQLIDLAVKQLDKTKITYALFTGGQSDIEKDLAKKEFQAGNVRVLLATIGAGSEGHTFTKADTAIFLERSWREIDNEQARNRIHRIGSEIHRRVEYITLIAEGTIDERQTAVLQLKEENLEAVVRDRRTLRMILTGEIPEELAG